MNEAVQPLFRRVDGLLQETFGARGVENRPKSWLVQVNTHNTTRNNNKHNSGLLKMTLIMC